MTVVRATVVELIVVPGIAALGVAVNPFAFDALVLELRGVRSQFYLACKRMSDNFIAPH